MPGPMNALDSRALPTHKISGQRRIRPYVGGPKISPVPVPRDYSLPPPISTKHLVSWRKFATNASRPGTCSSHSSLRFRTQFSSQFSASHPSSTGNLVRSSSAMSRSQSQTISKPGQARAQTAPHHASRPDTWFYGEDPFSKEEWAAGFCFVRSHSHPEPIPKAQEPPKKQSLRESQSQNQTQSQSQSQSQSLKESSSSQITQSSSVKGTLEAAVEDQGRGEEAQEEPEWLSVFLELSEDNRGKLPQKKISHALELIGFCPVDDMLLDSVLPEATGKTYTPSNIDKKTFGILVDLYEKAQHERMKLLYDKSDLNGDGVLNRKEISQLIRYELDFKMFPHVIDEVFDDVDADNSGCIDREEFTQVMHILQQRQGFSKSEVETLKSVFHRFAGLDGHVPLTNLGRMVRWLGYSATASELRSLAEEIDKDQSGSVSEAEFPLFLRKYREQELEKVGRFFGEHDFDHSGTIDRTELLELVWSMGFMIEPYVLDEFIEAANLQKVSHMLFEDFWGLLSTIREKGGFSKIEIERHDASFNRYALPLRNIIKSPKLLKRANTRLLDIAQTHSNEKHILVTQLGRALRWLGFTFNAKFLNKMSCEVDIEDCHSLDLEEFTRVLWNLRIQEVTELHRMYPPTQERQSPRKINPATAEFSGLLRRLGCVPTTETMNTALESLPKDTPHLDILGALKFIHHIRELIAESCRNNAGFSDRETAQYRAMFNKFDRDASDSINQSELIRLLGVVFHDSTEDEIAKIKDEVLAGGEGDGDVDFQEFLLLMRGHHDREEEIRIKEERQRLLRERAESEQNREHELKELFDAADEDKSGSLSIEEVQNLIAGVMGTAMSQPNVQHKLGMLLMEIDADGSGTMDFAEFENLVMRLEEENVGGINEMANEVVRTSIYS